MIPSKTISLRELYITDFDLTDIFAMRQKWKQNVLFKMSEKRRSTGMIYLNNCKGIYADKTGETFLAPEKSIVCLPQGSEYTCLNLECTNTLEDAVLIEFNAIKNTQILTFSDKPFLIKDVNIPIAADLFDDVVKAYKSSVPSILAVKMCVYRLLSHICKEKVQKHQERFSPIGTGIELIESDPLCEISVEEIAKTCNVSPCYFRRLFKEYSGKSPLEYRMELRLSMAKRMLEGGDSTLEYIAEASGFESTSYFCRVFKRKFGITPGQYRKDFLKV